MRWTDFNGLSVESPTSHLLPEPAVLGATPPPRPPRLAPTLCAAALCLTLSAHGVAQAGTQRAQTLRLGKGWNAVYLEVGPADPEPSAVFAGTPFDVVASYYAPVTSAQFVSNPGTDLFKTAGWGVWYAADRPDAFLKSLHAVHGDQVYLVHSRSDYTWTVTGEVLPPDVHWQADAFNLVGFSVDEQGPPTFAQFFGASPAHADGKIYRLSGDAWRQVADPSAETLRSGEAFWIYCKGRSSFAGPLKVETPLRRGLVLSAGSDQVVLRNVAAHPVTATVHHVPGGDDAVPMSIVMRTVGNPVAPVSQGSVPKPSGAWSQSLPPLEAGTALRLPLEARSEDLTQPWQSSLLKVTTDVGTVHWIPVIATREDLKAH